MLTTWPASTSACVSGYVAVHVVDAPGTSVLTGQVTVPTLRSVTTTLESVTLPVLVTRNVYGTVEPAVFPVAVPAFLSSVSDGLDVIGSVTVSVPDTAAPVGGFADTLAVLITCPAFTSARVSVYVAVQVVEAPGASWVAGQVTVPTLASVTATPVSVTLPVFVTRNEYGTVEPAVLADGEPTVFFSVTTGADAMGVVTASAAVTAAPAGGFADTLAELTTCPASTSAWVSVYVPVQVVDAAGASWVVGHDTVPTFASVTATLVSVTLPVLVTRNVYEMFEPAVVATGVTADFFIVSAGVRVIGVMTVLAAVNGAPIGGVPEAVAVLFTVPASTSACVSVYALVQVVDVAGASVFTGQVTVPTLVSVTPTLVSVTLPEFFTRNV